jgi:hypothetical protein
MGRDAGTSRPRIAALCPVTLLTCITHDWFKRLPKRPTPEGSQRSVEYAS